MSPLGERLRALIASSGPLSVEQYMAEALGHPEHGYYKRGDPFGAAGDFITAPEVSQMFGEIVGLWCAVTWQQMGRPAPVSLVELGPGRGTLLADALRAGQRVPAFRAAVEVHLVETSPSLRRRQRQSLQGLGARWHDRFADVPGGPVLLIANEFFDALPIRQFKRTADGWRERLVDVDSETGGLRFVLAPRPTSAMALIPPSVAGAPVGSVAETCPGGLRLAHEVALRVAADGGAALIIDYGPARSAPGNTLQAVKRHRSHPVLEDPGTADLTAHVDFAALARVAGKDAGAKVFGPVEQAVFLRLLGIEARAAALIETATPVQRDEIAAALRRLTDADQMGSLFKALAITHPGLPTPAGFEGAHDLDDDAPRHVAPPARGATTCGSRVG